MSSSSSLSSTSWGETEESATDAFVMFGSVTEHGSIASSEATAAAAAAVVIGDVAIVTDFGIGASSGSSLSLSGGSSSSEVTAARGVVAEEVRSSSIEAELALCK